MKKAIKVNIGGTIFHIDENAYDTLQNYLNNIERHFKSKPEGREIIADIEGRMSELLRDKLRNGREVVILHDVHDVINQMGQPEEMEEATTESSSSGYTYHRERKTRRLYRKYNNWWC